MKGKIQSIIDDYAASVIRAVMAEHRIGEKDFYLSNSSHFVKARVAAIKRLSSDGLSAAMVARAMKMHKSSIEYHIYPNRNARQLAQSRAHSRLRRSAKLLQAAE